MNRLGDTSAFVIPAVQLLLTRRGKTRMYTVGIVFEFDLQNTSNAITGTCHLLALPINKDKNISQSIASIAPNISIDSTTFKKAQHFAHMGSYSYLRRRNPHMRMLCMRHAGLLCLLRKRLQNRNQNKQVGY